MSIMWCGRAQRAVWSRAAARDVQLLATTVSTPGSGDASLGLAGVPGGTPALSPYTGSSSCVPRLENNPSRVLVECFSRRNITAGQGVRAARLPPGPVRMRAGSLLPPPPTDAHFRSSRLKSRADAGPQPEGSAPLVGTPSGLPSCEVRAMHKEGSAPLCPAV